jgi:threonine/homoserine/homoserine lactone efflux protein
LPKGRVIPKELIATLGLCAGGYVHVLAAALGLSALLTHVPTAYIALKFAGAAYLVWLGINMLRSSREQVGIPQSRKKSTKRAFPVWLQFLVLGAVVNIAFASADLVAVFFTSLVMEKMKRTGPYRKLTQWFAGSLMAILGVRLALSNESYQPRLALKRVAFNRLHIRQL